jgi:hypothetical protein
VLPRSQRPNPQTGPTRGPAGVVQGKLQTTGVREGRGHCTTEARISRKHTRPQQAYTRTHSSITTSASIHTQLIGTSRTKAGTTGHRAWVEVLGAVTSYEPNVKSAKALNAVPEGADSSNTVPGGGASSNQDIEVAVALRQAASRATRSHRVCIAPVETLDSCHWKAGHRTMLRTDITRACLPTILANARVAKEIRLPAEKRGLWCGNMGQVGGAWNLITSTQVSRQCGHDTRHQP